MAPNYIIGFAVLAAAWKHRQKNLVDLLVPFVAHVLVSQKYNTVALEDLSGISTHLEDELHLAIPIQPLRVAIERCIELGILKKTAYYHAVDQEVARSHDTIPDSDDVLARIGSLSTRFQKFCKDELGDGVPQGIASQGLFEVLRTADPETIEAINSGRRLELEEQIVPQDQLRFLLSKFILSNRESDDLGIAHEALIGLSIFSLLARNSTEEIKPSTRLKRLTVYLDTRFCFRLLGYETAEEEENAATIVRGVSKAGARIAVFQHTYDEMCGVLEACEDRLVYPYCRSDEPDLCRFFRGKGITSTEIAFRISSLRKRLSDLGIAIHPAPPHQASDELGIDRGRLAISIAQAYNRPYSTEAEALNDLTVVRDVDSLCAIAVLRKGRRARKIQEAEHLLITTNRALVSASRRFEQGNTVLRDAHPLCDIDFHVGSMLYFMGRVSEAAIETKLVAMCSSLLRPDRSFINDVIDIATRFQSGGGISEEEFGIACSESFLKYWWERKHGSHETDAFVDLHASIEDYIFRKRREDEIQRSAQIESGRRAQKQLSEAKKNVRKAAFYISIVLSVLVALLTIWTGKKLILEQVKHLVDFSGSGFSAICIIAGRWMGAFFGVQGFLVTMIGIMQAIRAFIVRQVSRILGLD